MSLVLVCICTLSVPRKSLAQETTDSATYAGSTTNAKTGDESKATIWIAIWIFSMLVFGCGIKYKKVTNK